MAEPGKELVLPESVRALPAPPEFAKLLREWLEEQIIAARKARGEVTSSEDVFDLVRSLQRTREVLGDYARALTSAANVAGQEIEEDLKYAVGEQQGIPNSGLTVPDTDGTDIKITLDMPGTHTIDKDEVLPAVAAEVLYQYDAVTGAANLGVAVALATDDQEQAVAKANLEAFLADVLVHGMNASHALGSFSLQVSKVKAFAKTLAGRGEDALASVVSKAIRTTKDFRSIKVTRAERK